jgi:hypothetical protein
VSVFALGADMRSRGRCENCDDPLKIVVLKFRWNGTRALWACPNCAMLRAEDQSDLKPLGSRGGSSDVDALQAVQGAPAAPQARA